MEQLLDVPLWTRLVVVFAASAVVASWLNAAIYEFAYDRRRFSPWQPTPPGVAPRGWLDRTPILGWLRLRRDRGQLGERFWVRPFLLELLFPLAIAALYWWEVERHALIDPQIPVAGDVNWRPLAGVLHVQFFAHALLAAFMWAATFIDFDEKTIPDAISRPGTLLALLVITLAPMAALPDVKELAAAPRIGVALVDTQNAPLRVRGGHPLYVTPVQPFSPNDWPARATDNRGRLSLLTGLGCLWLWCFAIADRTWPKRIAYPNRLASKLAVWLARLLRDLSQMHLRSLLVAGTLAVLVTWFTDGAAWLGLLNGLIGLVLGSVLVWAVRVVGSYAMGREAMGFGDVLLMMMVGVLLGWQACLVLFFLAPFAGLLLGLASLLFGRGDAIPYGPFLCLAAAVTVVRWGDLWPRVERVFEPGWLVPVMLVACVALLGVLLVVIQIAKGLFRERGHD
ncbi:MAG: prepilin peptidase [Planctomycetales bacterium]|nr:prepilin peptidase [Planctomycetales bacterium]